MKNLLIILIIVILITAGAIISVKLFLPSKIKSLAENFVRENLHKDIEISKVEVSFYGGIIFYNVSLYEKKTEAPYLKISKLRLMPLYPSLLTGEKTISVLTVDNAYIYLCRDKDGRFNLPEIKTGAGKKQPSVIVKNISFKNINLNFEDKKENFKKAFSDISLWADIDFNKIDFTLRVSNKITAKGKYSLNTNDIDANFSLNDIDLSEFSPYLKAVDLKSASLEKGSLHIEGNETYFIKGNIGIKNVFALKNDMEYRGSLIFAPDITITKEKSFIVGNIEIKDAGFIKDKMEFKGSLSLSPQITLSENSFSYYLEGNLKEAQGVNIPYINTLSDINAEFNLNKEKLTLLSLEAKSKENILHAQGEINYAGEPILYLDIKTNTSLADFARVVKQIKPIPLEYNGQGNIDLTCNINSDLKQKTFNYNVDYEITGAGFQDFDNIRAKGNLKNGLLILQEGSFNYKKNPFKINGELEDFALPQIKLNLNNGTFNLTAHAKLNKNNIEVDKLAVSGKQTDIIGYGGIEIKDNPLIKFEGYGKVGLQEITKQINDFGLNYPLLNNLSPQGELGLKFTITGSPKLNDWEIKLAGAGDNVKIYNLLFTEPKIELYKNKDELTISPLIINFGEGNARLRAKFDFSNNKKTVDLTLDNIDLAYISEQLKLNNKNLAGKLFMEANLENNGIAGWDKMDGEGKVIIKEGNLWELSLLKGLGEFLSINEFDKITFKDGSSDLFFKEENIIFENMTLISALLTLKGNGEISVKDAVNFTIFPEFNPLLIAKSEGLNALLSEFIGKNILAVEIEGTLKDPKYKKKPVTLNPVNGIKNILKGITK